MNRILLRVLGIVFGMLFLIACAPSASTPSETSLPNEDATESTAEQPEASEPRTAIYLSPTGSDETGDGSLENPWQSVTRARDYIRTINQGLKNDIHVFLRGGTYYVDNEIVFSKEDSGESGETIYYENYKDETPILNGGQQITGWQLYDSENNIYQAKVDSTDGFRQLYINGERAILARTPNMTEEDTFGPYYLGGRWNYLNQYETNPYPTGPYFFTVSSNNVPDWNGEDPLELVTVDHWRNKVAHVSSFEKNGSSTIVKLGSVEALNGIFSHGNQYIDPVYTPYYFENSLSLLDQEGEWYFDQPSSTVYYKPRATDDMSNIVAIAPKTDKILNIIQIEDGKVSNLVFKGITFEYTNWNEPSKYGYANWQAALAAFQDNNSLLFLPGAIQLYNAENIRIDSCTIRHTGANAIVASEYGGDTFVANCVFQNNTITDTSAGGIYLNLNNSDSTGNVIQNNLVEYGGRQYADAVGILVTCTPNTKVLHNEVCYFGYAGISIGWDWGDGITAAQNIEVAYNKIHDVMQLLDDAGGIYTMGNIPDGRIHDNYIYNIQLSKYQGSNMKMAFNPVVAITNDGGCNKEFYNNVIENVDYAISAVNNPNYDNVFRNNYYSGKIGFISDKNINENNTQVNGEWPEAAASIIANAGIEAN